MQPMSAPQENEFDRQQFFELFSSPEVPFSYKAMLVLFAGLYLISPIDLLPDFLFGFLGYADDFGMIMGMAQVFTWASNKYLRRKHEEEEMIIDDGTMDAQASELPSGLDNSDEPQMVIAPPAESDREKPPKPDESTPVVPAEGVDYRQDEWHERFVNQRRERNQEDFDETVSRNEKNKLNQDWDYSRNDPFQKRQRRDEDSS
jgi:uncharacterized membrane protein YkvA (DUF1232 family)